MEMKMSTEVVR